jgi:hypothetical protein
MKLYFPLIFTIIAIFKLAVFWLLGINHDMFALENIQLTIIEIIILGTVFLMLSKKGITEKKIPVFLGVTIILTAIFLPSYLMA